MMKSIVNCIAMCLSLLFCASCQSQDGIISGNWSIIEITGESPFSKTQDQIVSVSHSMIIKEDSRTIVIRFSDGTFLKADYELINEGDSIKIYGSSAPWFNNDYSLEVKKQEIGNTSQYEMKLASNKLMLKTIKSQTKL